MLQLIRVVSTNPVAIEFYFKMSMLEIQCRSVAGRGTAVMVRYPRSTLLFDCGVEEEFCLRASHIFLTHCHLGRLKSSK